MMNLPSREECEGWDQDQVVHFMCQNKMPECAVTVNRLRINGHRFLNLSDSEMSKFSLIHQPQLQKIVQDIKKNDGSLLNRLKRLKSKPRPNVPVRDYRDDNRENDDQLSDPDYDNDMYDNPHEDDGYEPPPSHRVFPTTPSGSFPTGEYLDSCRNRPSRPPKKPFRPGKPSKQLPPEPPPEDTDEEDYIDPDVSADEDNYVEPAENPPPTAVPPPHGGSRAGRDLPMLPPHATQREPSPEFYEVPDSKENSSLSTNRLLLIPPKQTHSAPPKLTPRLHIRSHSPVQEPACDDEYEVCDPEEAPSNKPAEVPRPRVPTPLPRERSPKPPATRRPEVKQREFESRTLPVVQTQPTPPPKPFMLDMKRPKVPLLQTTSLKPPERRSVSAENRSPGQDMDADVMRRPWFANTCDRRTADDALCRSNKDGAFMVRKSSGQDAQQPYTLVVFYNSRVYNIPIRLIPATQQFALGREKRGEEFFNSVSHIIETHQRIPLVLIDSQSNAKDATKLCYPVKP